MKIFIITFLIIPLFASLSSFIIKNKRFAEYISLLSSSLCLLGAFIILYFSISLKTISIFNSAIVIDKFSAYIILLVSIVYFLSSMYSISYMRLAMEGEQLTGEEFNRYYLFLNLFALTMLMAPMINNMAIYLIDIELTTIASAFLVIAEVTEKSIEAAWKYILIVSAGISLALLGTILFYLSGNIPGSANTISSLDWTTLRLNAVYLNKDIIRFAFVLIVIGLGTKVGLAPMHTWLPDAHSEAPSPISSMLSASLLNTAMYGIMRYFSITGKGIGFNYPQTIMVIIGIFTIFTGVMGIINQKSTKRLFAYSSIEHMGIISLGFGLGGAFGTFGALLQMLGHSLAKPVMFFGSGNLLHKYKTKDIKKIKGVFYVMPKTAFLFSIGVLALIGSPPSVTFISEFLIILQSLKNGYYAVAIVLVSLLIAAFVSLLSKVGSIVFGKDDNSLNIQKGDFGLASVLPMALPLAALIILGFYIPGNLYRLLMGITHIIIIK
ncbi:MAG: proton-conducting transporter membrane subunit [Deltaproteobacteria bacterium]|nr:hydrogenase 4 subunit F [Deltaproteobacteria bacterium]MCL5879936.1 hydrogenase 4 subunit F [Deltaproteobacteria bacterium]MDA8304337.1 proton-conducting transporter membrane subunit [Deltaproteobacteria bacterium]